MWWFSIGKPSFHRLIVLLVLKPTSIILSTDCSVGYGLVTNQAFLRYYFSSCLIRRQDSSFPQPSPFHPNPIPNPILATPLVVRVKFLVSASLSLLTPKSKENEKLWLVVFSSCWRHMAICLPWITTWIVFFFQKRNTVFARRQFLSF